MTTGEAWGVSTGRLHEILIDGKVKTFQPLQNQAPRRVVLAALSGETIFLQGWGYWLGIELPLKVRTPCESTYHYAIGIFSEQPL